MKTEDNDTYYKFINDKSNINPQDKLTYPPVVISCGTFIDYEDNEKEYPIPIGTYENFSFIQSLPKQKKTYFACLLAAIYLAGSIKQGGNLKGHRGNKKCLHIDTEQGRWHAHRSFRRASRAGHP